jgi:(2Fe-2S) ferredoxin
MCDEGPVVGVQPENTFYGHMTVERVPTVVQALADGTIAQDFVVQSASSVELNKER